MMTYEEFEEACLKSLEDRVCDEWKSDMARYIKEDDSQEIMREFYESGVERYEKGTKKDNKLAFGCCVSTAAENMRLLY